MIELTGYQTYHNDCSIVAYIEVSLLIMDTCWKSPLTNFLAVLGIIESERHATAHFYLKMPRVKVLLQVER